MAETRSMVEQLIFWASSLGTELHPDVEIYEDSVTGLSFRARKDIPFQTKWVNCSYRVTLSYLNAVNTPGFFRHGEAFPEQFLANLGPEDPNIISHFFLMQQYLLGETSFWWPYIRLLPQPDKPSIIPALWPEEDQKYLNGTNAEPAIRKRTALWREEWVKAAGLLQGFENDEQYTYDLYTWAASIFGSRSFRPSLTIPEGLVPDHGEHVRKDKFSVLLPVMDIGNHNGVNNVEWKPDPASGVFVLSNRSTIRQNEQIFNYYGNKSNSELLVGFGFTLPTTSDLDRDVVNLKLTPSLDALALRRSQRCHVIPKEPEEEFMFAVQKQVDPGDYRIFQNICSFSPGLVDLVVCMVANKREKLYLSRTPHYCPENGLNVFESPCARAIFTTLQILIAKLLSEHDRIAAAVATLCEPQNANQRTSSEYTQRQLSILSTVKTRFVTLLGAALRTFRRAANAPSLNSSGLQLLSLENAFGWLRVNYLDIHTAVVGMISEDQNEPLPLDWKVLAEDWDHTYWIVWIFIVWLLWAREGEAFRGRYKSLSAWLCIMNCSYDDELAASAKEVLYADRSEQETIVLMIKGITNLPQFSDSDMQTWLHHKSTITRIRNFASFIATEETFLANYKLGNNDSNGGRDGSVKSPEEKTLCIVSRHDCHLHDLEGSWTACMKQSPGFHRSPLVEN